MKIFLGCLLALALIVSASAVKDLIWSPYSDQELIELVDSWEVYAGFTILVLVLMTGVAAVSTAAAVWKGDRRRRRLALATLVVAVAAAGLQTWSHAALTKRTTRVSGQTFGGFYGLL